MASKVKNFDIGIALKPVSSDPSSPVEGQLQVSDGTHRAKGLWIYKDGAWAQAGGSGGGGLDIFYQEDFETSVDSSDFTTGNNATFDNGGTLDGTLADETSSQIAGTQSLKYTMGSSSANDWIKSPDIAIDSKQASQTVGLQFYYTYNGDDGDIKIIGYDDTGAEVMTLATDTLKATSTPTRFSVQFPVPSTSTSLNWGFQVVTGNSGKVLLIDDVEISTNPFVYKELSNDEDWIDFTPTSSWISNATHTGKWRRDSNMMTIQYTVTCTGAPTATSLKFDVPSGYTVDEDKLTAAATSPLGTAIIINAGVNNYIGVSDYRLSDNKIAVLTGDPAGQVSSTVPFSFGAGDTVDVVISVPIEGWSAKTENIVSYNARNAESLRVEGRGNGGTSKTSSDDIDFTETVDTGFGGASWNGTQFTSQETDMYWISGSVIQTGTTAIDLLGYIDGTLDKSMGKSGSADNLHMFGGLVYLEKGEVWSLRPSATITLFNNANYHHITIYKLGVGDLLGVPKSRTCYIKDVKSSGTGGGTFTSGSYQTRVLNTLEGDTEFVSLSSNQFTLESGKYEIESTAPVFNVSNHKMKLYNTTDASDAIIGTSCYADQSNAGANNATLKGTLTLTASKTFELRHRCNVTQVSNGFGVASAYGDNEIYAVVKITKVA